MESGTGLIVPPGNLYYFRWAEGFMFCFLENATVVVCQRLFSRDGFLNISHKEEYFVVYLISSILSTNALRKYLG